jgi:hypothetical protein
MHVLCFHFTIFSTFGIIYFFYAPMRGWGHGVSKENMAVPDAVHPWLLFFRPSATLLVIFVC